MVLDTFFHVQDTVFNVEMALRGIEALSGATEHSTPDDPVYRIGKLARVLADQLHTATEALDALPCLLADDPTDAHGAHL